MKRLRIAAALCAVAAALLLSPFHSRDAAKLIPVQTISVCAGNGACRVETDGGLYGQGPDPASAFRDLERTAPGLPVFSTARQLVVDETALSRLRDLVFLESLHPGTEVYLSAEPIDAGDATDFLNRHASGVSVSRLRSALLTGEAVPLPEIAGAEGRYRIDGTR